MFTPYSTKLYLRPESGHKIAQISHGLLLRADCLGVLPTPIEQLYDVANVQEIALDRSQSAPLWRRFTERAQQAFLGLIEKVRGAADLRKRVVFIPHDDSEPRILFARSHELGHQALPWHHINRDYLDDDQTLSPQIKAQFEIEANLFAAETIYQGQRFQGIARQYRPALSAIFLLAKDHGASRHATFWRFVEDHDEALAGLVYYLNDKAVIRSAVRPMFRLSTMVRSRSFQQKIGDLTFPVWLEFDHVWAQAQLGENIAMGEMPATSSRGAQVLLWEAWWNRYCLLVLVRRKPMLRIVGKILRGN